MQQILLWELGWRERQIVIVRNKVGKMGDNLSNYETRWGMVLKCVSETSSMTRTSQKTMQIERTGLFLPEQSLPRRKRCPAISVSEETPAKRVENPSGKAESQLTP